MSGRELKRGARALIRERSPKIFVIVVLYVVIITVLSELEYRLPGTAGAYEQFIAELNRGVVPSFELLLSGIRPTGAALAMIIMLMLPVIQVGFMSCCLRISRGIAADIKDIFDGFAYFPKILGITLLIGLIVFLWSLLLIVPGIIAAYRYSQAYYILIDDPKKGVLQCLRESKRLMAGKKTDLFFLDLSFIGWFLLNALIAYFVEFPLPIVAVWLEPYIGITRAGFYNQLTTIDNTPR